MEKVQIEVACLMKSIPYVMCKFLV